MKFAGRFFQAIESVGRDAVEVVQLAFSVRILKVGRLKSAGNLNLGFNFLSITKNVKVWFWEIKLRGIFMLLRLYVGGSSAL